MEETPFVKVIIVLSGKRKSGKDFLANSIISKISEEKCHVLRVAAPIKKHFCEIYNMNYEEMMTSSKYKELRRSEMIKWGEEQRNNDVGIFCCSEKNEAVKSKKPVWILSDARRSTDVEYFREYADSHGIQFFAIRISADIKTRENRGWKFTRGVDDVASECALDNYNKWSFSLNNSDADNILYDIEQICREFLQFL